VFGNGGVSVLNRWDNEICISFQSPLTVERLRCFNPHSPQRPGGTQEGDSLAVEKD